MAVATVYESASKSQAHLEGCGGFSIDLYSNSVLKSSLLIFSFMAKVDCGSGYFSCTADAPAIPGRSESRSLHQSESNAVVCQCNGNELLACERQTASLEKDGHKAIVGARRQCAALCRKALSQRR